jgi:hypothetical protein
MVAHTPPPDAPATIGMRTRCWLEVSFNDKRTVRFRVLSRDPATVQAVGTGPMPEHEAAAEDWLDQQSGRSAA